MLLSNIENVSIDGRTGQDTIDVGSLLDTSVQTVDLQLGSDVAKAWTAQRDVVTGQQQVFPANYGATEANPGGIVTTSTDLREGQYFYRYDLAENGSYLFNDDGSPRLFEVMTPATVSGANQQTQSIALADGLARVTLFYGYDAAGINSGYIAKSGTSNGKRR
jgi:hypothetical protein